MRRIKTVEINENPTFVSHFKGNAAIVATNFVKFKVLLMFFLQSSYVTEFCKFIVFGLCYQNS